MACLRENGESSGINAVVRFVFCYCLTGIKPSLLIGFYHHTLTCLEEAKYYKTVAPNITRFDNGPRVVRHPPPSVSLGEDLGLNVSWSCDAVAEGNVAYSWLKNDQVTKFEVIKFSLN